ncbi:MAG: hypothetical protein ACREGC_03190, partial [Minisyncoccia bacterium]
PAYDVRVTATFYNAAHAIVDIKQAVVTAGATPIPPGQSLPFSTLPTTTIFTTYELAIDASQSPSQDTQNFAPTPTQPPTNYALPN